MSKQTETEKEVLRILKKQWKKGRITYGQGISFRQSNDPIKWADEAIEECIDQLQYLVALKMMLLHRAK